MDRRSLLFIVTLTLALFGVKYAFNYYNAEQQKEWLEKNAKIIEAKEALAKKELDAKRPSAQELGLVELINANGSKLDGILSASLENAVLASTNAKNYSWPQTVIANDISYELAATDAAGHYAIYNKGSIQQPIAFYSLPEQGVVDLAIVSPALASDKNGISIVLGQAKDGLYQIVEKPPHSFGIAFVKVHSHFVPCALYNPYEKKLAAFDSVKEFALITNRKEEPLFGQSKQGPKQYYVLQNAYQQLVFSNHGGALVEINLPFKTETDTKSSVLPIEFDKEIQEQNPKNALFPLHKALLPNGKTLSPIEGGFYPLLRRSQLASQGNSGVHIPPSLLAFNFVSEYPEVSELVYTVKKFTNEEIVFEASQGHRRITKRFYFPKDVDSAPYCFVVELKVDGDSRGLWLSSGVPEIEWVSGSPGTILKYRVTRGQKSEVEKIDLPKTTFNLSSVYPDWICNSNGFFGIIVDPIKGIDPGMRVECVDGVKDPSRLALIDTEYGRFSAKDLPGYNMLVPLKQSAGTTELRVFAGPFADNVLKQVDSYFSAQEGVKTSDYLSCQTFHGWFAFISEPFAKFLFFLMNIFHSLFGSWGISIILVTVVLRILLYPLNTWSLRSMKRMQEISPQVKAIQERYKKEPQKAQIEIMNLYREQKVNPVSGCLPLLLQMPFLIGMFDLLKSTFELRGAPFIPGWIDNLAAPDVLFSWKTQLPLIGNQFHLLPILLGGIMYIQQNYMTSAPKNVSEMTEQQRQQKAMGNIMTVFMTVLFYQFPSGLNIYWISSTLLGVLQQWYMNRKPSTTTVEIQPKATSGKYSNRSK